MSTVIGSNINRIKNILSGDYTAKTTTSVGFTKSRKKHKEGDVWQEGGKTWTIINGLKQTYSKLDTARQSMHIPWSCPECSKPLKHLLDKRAWKIEGHCFDCVSREETQMILDGTFEAHTKSAYKENALAWLKEKREQFEIFINDKDTLRGFVTQNGEIEDWSGGPDKQKLIDQFEKEYLLIKERIDGL